MSVRVLGKVLRQGEPRLGERLVLIALADSASDDGVTWAPQDELAAKACLSNSQTRKCLDGLERAGHIERRKAQRGRRRINVYRVVLAGLAEVDYDRLPFELREPFATADIERSSESDDRRNRPSTAAEIGSRLHGDPSEEPSTGSSTPPAEQPGKPPALTKVDGRNLGYDALAEVCGIDVRNRTRSGEVARALKDVRAYCWEAEAELRERIDGYEPRPPIVFERFVADEVRRRAELYRRRLPGAELTPGALAKWWHDVDRGPQGARRLSGSQIANLSDEEVAAADPFRPGAVKFDADAEAVEEDG